MFCSLRKAITGLVSRSLGARNMAHLILLCKLVGGLVGAGEGRGAGWGVSGKKVGSVAEYRETTDLKPH